MVRLEAALDGCLAGRGALVLLAGEPGIGKTRSAQELVTRARARHAVVLVARCLENEGAPPYWPWIRMIRARVSTRDPAEAWSEMGQGAAEIRQLVPRLGERVPRRQAPPPSDPAEARFRLFDSITTFFTNVARRQPLVLVLDDLHSADAASLLLLEFLANELADLPLLVVGTYREGESSASPPLARTLGELSRHPHVQRLHLRGLTEGVVAAIMEEVAGTRPSAALVARVHRDTGGNPFFVTEIVRLLVAEGRLGVADDVDEPLHLPETVRDVIFRRLNRLSAACRTVLTHAAVVGREFSLVTLERLADLERRTLLTVLEEAVASRVVVPLLKRVGRYAFEHGLIRETLYQALDAPERVRLHRRMGHILRDLHQTNPAPHLAELAHHFFCAAEDGDAGPAIDYGIRAGRHALDQLAWEEAILRYRRALQALELQVPVDEARRCDALLGLGDALTRAGDGAQAREMFLRAAAVARALPSAEALAHAALGWGTWMCHETRTPDERLIGLLEDAREALGPRDSALRSRVLGRLARALYAADSPERRARLASEAVAMAERLGDPSTLGFVLTDRRHALRGPDDVEKRLADADRALRLGEATGDRQTIVSAHLDRALDRLDLGDVVGADRDLDVCVRMADGLRQPLFRLHIAAFRAERALLEGRFEECQRLIEQVLAVASQANDTGAVGICVIQSAFLHKARGGSGDVEPALRAFVEHVPSHLVARCTLLSLYVDLGMREEVRRHFEYVARNDLVDVPRDFGWLAAMASLAEGCAFLGDVRRAEALYQLLRPYAGRIITIPYTVCLGSASDPLGRLASTRSRWEEAEQHFEDALGQHRRMGARALAVSTLHAYAAMLLARARPTDQRKAIKLLSCARAEEEALGMAPVAERTLAKVRDGWTELAATGADRPVDEREADQTEEAVLRREGEYWTIRFGAKVMRLRDTLGLHHLARLLGHPGHEFFAGDMVAPRQDRSAPEHGSDPFPTEARAGTLGDAGEILDAQATGAYRLRLEGLREQLAEARAFNDTDRATGLREEIAALAGELARGVGLGRRNRRAGSHAERARVKVTHTIRDTIRRIAHNDPSLGRYLATTVKTGTFCSYTPDPRIPIRWSI